jgi:flagellin-like protein
MGMSMRKAVSPVIATLLLIAIAVAAGIILYVFVSGFTGSLTQTGGQQAAEQVVMDAYDFKTLSPTPTLSITFRNTGTVEVTIDKLYYDASLVAISPRELNVGDTTNITFNPTDATRGSSHLIKVVTKTGGIFTFTVIAGRSG